LNNEPTRGLSQILFGYLPEQTVDLNNRIWRVRRWILPRHLDVDGETVRRELLRTLRPWTDNDRDGNLAEDLRRGVPVHVLEVNEYRGVEVERFPRVFRCTTCSRLERDDANRCRCGARTWVQWHFVSYHECGSIGAPRFRRCPDHQQVKVILPGTASARDLRFECPICHTLLHKGFFAGARCEDCKIDTPLRHDVHRAASVYSAKTLTLVNPPDATTAQTLREPTAGAQKLRWVLDGLPTDGGSSGPTIDTVIAGLVAAGMTSQQAREQADRMASSGVLGEGSPLDDLPLSPDGQRDAQDAAMRLWLAQSGGRLTFDRLDAEGRLPAEYRDALASAGLEAIDLLDDFPILTCRYGYTRSSGQPGVATLRRFVARDGGIAVHGQLARTEGLLVRLNPVIVAQWLAARAYLDDPPSDPGEARAQIMQVSTIPDPYDEPAPSAGSAVLTLVHTMSHRLVRRLSALAGLERDSIAEYLVPEHLSFVVYAATRGDFVLGGLQAVFEHDLHVALRELASGDMRCALDPGCRRHGNACVACLHLGEPSCRHYNRFLDRSVLGPGEHGYFSIARHASCNAR
jgi:hypothetical protein